MVMAHAVAKLASKTPGKEAVAMESFAKALRMVTMERDLSINFMGVDFKLNAFSVLDKKIVCLLQS